MTDSMREAIRETERRRKLQIEFNEKHNIKPKTIIKAIKEKIVEIKDTKHIARKDIPGMVINLETEMQKSADRLDFETAIMLRDKIKKLKERIL